MIRLFCGVIWGIIELYFFSAELLNAFQMPNLVINLEDRQILASMSTFCISMEMKLEGISRQLGVILSSLWQLTLLLGICCRSRIVTMGT